MIKSGESPLINSWPHIIEKKLKFLKTKVDNSNKYNNKNITYDFFGKNMHLFLGMETFSKRYFEKGQTYLKN